MTSGQVFEHFGAAAMFKSYGVSALVVLVIYMILQIIIKKTNGATQLQQSEEDTTPTETGTFPTRVSYM